MEEFDELELQKLIETALSDTQSSHPFGGSATHLGFAETDILSLIFSRLENKLHLSEVSDIFHDVRVDLLSRKFSSSLADLHTVTKNCRKCSLQSTPELPKWNVQDPDVVVIIDSPSLSPEATANMVSSFKEAGFSSDQLCLTYVNRCPVRRKYEDQEIINCSPYLHAEVQMLNPKLILCLGATPASVLFGSHMKISDSRANILWLGHWPILVTYSPMYVLKSGSSASEQFNADIQQAYQFVSKTKGSLHA